jgi:hypothetical protein
VPTEQRPPENGDPITALLELPVVGASFWVVLEERAAEDIVARFASIVDGSQSATSA